MRIDRSEKPSRSRLPRLVAAGVLLIAGIALLLPSQAAGSACTADPAAAARVQAAIARLRTLCPCTSFASRSAYRSCLRRGVEEAATRGDMPRACRGDAMRLGTVSTCGRRGVVTCCKARASGRESCSVGTFERCTTARGGRAGRVGATESCYDACAPATPTASPSPSPSPSPVPSATPTPTAQQTPSPTPSLHGHPTESPPPGTPTP